MRRSSHSVQQTFLTKSRQMLLYRFENGLMNGTFCEIKLEIINKQKGWRQAILCNDVIP